MNTVQRIALTFGLLVAAWMVLAPPLSQLVPELLGQGLAVALVIGAAFVILGGDKKEPPTPTPDQRIPSKDQ